MPAITQQRYDNVRTINDLALKLYDLRTPENQRHMMGEYASHAAREFSVVKQREMIARLEKLIKLEESSKHEQNPIPPVCPSQS